MCNVDTIGGDKRMEENNDLVQYGEILVGIADQKYLHGDLKAYQSLLLGSGSCKLEDFPGGGHNYRIMIDAIHLYYKQHLYPEVIYGYLNGMKSILTNVTDSNELQRFLDILFYELEKETQGNANFFLPVGELLSLIKTAIHTYHLESVWNSYAGEAKEKYDIKL